MISRLLDYISFGDKSNTCKYKNVCKMDYCIFFQCLTYYIFSIYIVFRLVEQIRPNIQMFLYLLINIQFILINYHLIRKSPILSLLKIITIIHLMTILKILLNTDIQYSVSTICQYLCSRKFSNFNMKTTCYRF